MSKKNKNKKKSSFLTTNQWLGEKSGATPAPESKPDLAVDATDAIGGAMPADAPGSMLPLGRERGDLAHSKPSDTPSSKIISRSELAEMTAAMAAEDDDAAIDLATPPGGATTGPPSLSKILKATGTKSDILRPGKGDSGVLAGPASGWLPQAPKGGSRTDIGGESGDIFTGAGTNTNLPGMSGIGRSSIFNEPSRSGSSGIGMGGESDLFAGLTSSDRGSSVYDDSAKKTQRVPPPNLDDNDDEDSVSLMDFDDATEIDAQPIHSGPASSARLADRLLAGLADSSGGNSRPDFNLLDKSASGSNLFDDVTAMDIDLGSEAGQSGTSGINWLNPDLSLRNQDSGPGSSIFMKPPSTDQPSDPGHVDFSSIPMMGSTDDPDQQVKNEAYAGPASSVFKEEIKKAMKELQGEKPGAISFDLPSGEGEARIAWGTPQSTLNEQLSQRMSAIDDELDLAAPSGAISGLGMLNKRPKKDSDSVFDDTLEMPDNSGILMKNTGGGMSGSILQGVTSDDLRYDASKIPVTKKAKAPSTRDLDLDEKTAPRSKSRGGLLATLGLLVGVGGGAAGMYFLGPKDTTTPVAGTGGVKAGDSANAARLLAAGDPAAALVAFGEFDDGTASTRAGRGQARWMARLREAAAKGEKLKADDKAIATARAELQSVVDQAANLKSPSDQQAGLRAAINLGLIHETVGKPGDAISLYRNMGAKLPAYKKVFDTAEQRVTLMRTDVTDVKIGLALPDAMNLAGANLILLDFDPVQPLDDEPGFHFWEAVQFSTDWAGKGTFDKAIASINKAKAAHATRRLKYAGLGLNPLSDPSEQMFLRACDELNAYWTLKKRIYNDETGKAIAMGSGPKDRKNLDAIVQDLLKSKKLGADAETKIASLTKKANDATSELTAAKGQVSVAVGAKETAEKALEALKTDVANKTKAAEDLKASADAAMAKLKTADAALDGLIQQLKDAKVIEEKATREEAIAALPKAVLIGGGTGDTAKLAKELVALKEKSAADLKAAEDKIAKLAADVKGAKEKEMLAVTKATADSQVTLKDTEAKLAAAEAASRKEKEQAAATVKRERDLNEAKLAALVKEHEEQIAAVRAGATVAMSDGERLKLDDASRAYGLGLDAYFSNRPADAAKFFETATKKNPSDARYWYYLGLTKLRQGADATADFAKGAALESKGLPTTNVVSADLSGVQGALRNQLDAARP